MTTLYWNMGSQPSLAIKALLVAGDVEHEDKHTDLDPKVYKSPEFLAMNPQGKLPFITQDGKGMNESAAILRYLAQKHESLNKFYGGSLEHK